MATPARSHRRAGRQRRQVGLDGRGIAEVSWLRIRLVFVWPVRIPAWLFPRPLWFLYQLIEANFGLFSARVNCGGVESFAHLGGFIFGVTLPRPGRRCGEMTIVREVTSRSRDGVSGGPCVR